jgi:hypothetical protein
MFKQIEKARDDYERGMRKLLEPAKLIYMMQLEGDEYVVVCNDDDQVDAFWEYFNNIRRPYDWATPLAAWEAADAIREMGTVLGEDDPNVGGCTFVHDVL